MVEAMDRAVGTVLDKIESSGLEDDTLVVFFSDNGGLATSEGTPTSNLPLRTGKGWVYEGGIRVPAIIKWPKVAKAGDVSDTVITSMDFYPTILDAAGITQRPDLHIDGKSLKPVLQKRADVLHESVYFHYPHRSNQRGYPSAAVRNGDHKLIVNLNENRVELYDLSKDVGETNDLSSELPDVRDRLFADLKSWWKDVEARFPKESKIEL